MSTRYNGAYIIDLPDAAEDPSPAIEKDCHGSCLASHAKYEECAQRIEGKPDAHCTGQYLDYLACVDKCSAGLSRARALRRRASRRAPADCTRCCALSVLGALRSQKVCAHPGLEPVLAWHSRAELDGRRRSRCSAHRARSVRACLAGVGPCRPNALGTCGSAVGMRVGGGGERAWPSQASTVAPALATDRTHSMMPPPPKFTFNGDVRWAPVQTGLAASAHIMHRGRGQNPADSVVDPSAAVPRRRTPSST